MIDFRLHGVNTRPLYAPRPPPGCVRLCYLLDSQVWDHVYGFDMSVIKEIALTEPLVDVVEGKVRGKTGYCQQSVASS